MEVTEYRIPVPLRAGTADPGSLGVERWACGVCASFEEWPEDRYTFVLPDIGRPVFVEHEAERLVTSGTAPGDVGVARRFADLDGLIVCLLEISNPSVMWDLSRGVRCGLSVTAHTDPPPDGGPEWVYIAEVSLCEHPKDVLARVVSLGEQGLRDWAVLTGEEVR
jgi:hypothetical protein